MRIEVRKVIVSEFETLDGMMEDPGWTAPFTGEEQERMNPRETHEDSF
jgi:hypothetical protein